MKNNNSLNKIFLFIKIINLIYYKYNTYYNRYINNV